MFAVTWTGEPGLTVTGFGGLRGMQVCAPGIDMSLHFMVTWIGLAARDVNVTDAVAAGVPASMLPDAGFAVIVKSIDGGAATISWTVVECEGEPPVAVPVTATV
jgi:hypothetical protein